MNPQNESNGAGQNRARVPDGAKILLFKYDGIGDMLFLRMFFETLSEVLKKRHIRADFLCCERFRDVLTNEEKKIFEAVHFERAGNFLIGRKKLKAKILSFIPKYAGKIAAHGKIAPLIGTHFDVLMNLNITSNVEKGLFGALKGAQRFTTRNLPGETMNFPCDKCVTMRYDNFVLNLYRDILSEYFDTPFPIPSLSLPFTKEQSLRTAVDVLGEREYVCFAPFTSSHTRNWDARNFVFAARELHKKTRLKIAILGSTREKSIFHDIQNEPNVINLVNKTSLRQAMHIAAASKYAIVCDTSLMHFARIGGSNCICVSCGDCNKLFVEYPKEYNIRQTILYPESFDPAIGVRHSGLNVNLITPQRVLGKIDETWDL